MRIHSVVFREIGIPLNFQFSQANNSGTSRSSSALIALQVADGPVGYGEACPRSYVTGERMADVAADVDRLEPELLREPISSPEALQQKLKTWATQGIGASTRCAIELAWLDAWSRALDQGLRELWEIQPQPPLAYSMVLPLASGRTLNGLLERLHHLRPPAVKLKVNEDQTGNLDKVRLIQEKYGAEVPVRVDVNGGWTREQAKQYIPEFLALGVRSFEQPMDPADLEGLQMLTRQFGQEASIMADESLLSPEHALYLMENRICNHFNLKISKLGGLFSSLEVYHLAAQFGVPCQLGVHFGETSLLTSAGALLAAIVNSELSACEGALGEFLLSADICEPSIQQDRYGKLALDGLWNTPGLVEKIRTEKLVNFSRDR